MKPLIVGVYGKKRTGKDTFVRHCISKKDRHVVQYNFSRPIYSMLIDCFLDDDEVPPFDPVTGDWDKEQIIEPYGVNLRHMLQTLGTDWGRNLINKDVWVFKAQQWLDKVLSSPLANKRMLIIFSDVRFSNEVNFIKRNGGYLVEVRRDTGLQDNHASENEEIDESLVDYVIHNNGTFEEYGERIDKVLDSLEA